MHKLSGDWNLDQENQELTLEKKYKNFIEAFEAVKLITELAEEQNHHPDIEFGWGYLRLKLKTHSENKITDLDFKLAAAIDQVL